VEVDSLLDLLYRPDLPQAKLWPTYIQNIVKFYNAHYMNHGLNIAKGQPDGGGGGPPRLQLILDS
jgi:hypothetical protein